MQGTNKQRHDLGAGFALWTYTAPDGTARAMLASGGIPKDQALWDGDLAALRAAVASVAKEREAGAFSVGVSLSADAFTNLLISAIENNYMTRAWCSGVYWKTPEADPPPGLWYADAKNFAGDFVLTVVEFDEDMGDETRHTCDREAFERGARILATKYPHHFADIMTDNADAITADVFLQCAALGDIVYG